MKILLILMMVLSFNVFAEKAYFAGGCFWCMEADFEKLDGVSEAISGFTGGTLHNPTYRGNHKGHYEAIEVEYDPHKISYQELLEYYWVNIDPFDNGGQFCDRGFSYLSVIFVSNDNERELAQLSKKEIERKFPNKKVATRIMDVTTFYPLRGSESIHQDYYKNNQFKYKYYRWECGRDQRLKEIWGNKLSYKY